MNEQLTPTYAAPSTQPTKLWECPHITISRMAHAQDSSDDDILPFLRPSPYNRPLS